MSRQQVVHLNGLVGIGTLADVTAIVLNTKIDASREQGVKIRQLKASMSYNGKTASEGPLIVGVAVELTAVEIAEAMNADPQRWDDTDAKDKGNRKVFPIWTIPAGVLTGDDRNQKLEEINIPWKIIPEGSTLKWFVFNASGSTLTTGTIVHVHAAAVTEWLND